MSMQLLYLFRKHIGKKIRIATYSNGFYPWVASDPQVIVTGKTLGRLRVNQLSCSFFFLRD